MEDIITNFELAGTRLLAHLSDLRAQFQDKPYDLKKEQAVLAEARPNCGFNFPRLETQPTSFAVFKDVE